jgi:hypothetical protein
MGVKRGRRVRLATSAPPATRFSRQCVSLDVSTARVSTGCYSESIPLGVECPQNISRSRAPFRTVVSCCSHKRVWLRHTTPSVFRLKGPSLKCPVTASEVTKQPTRPTEHHEVDARARHPQPQHQVDASYQPHVPNGFPPEEDATCTTQRV